MFGACLNIALAALKLVAGIVFSSASLIADAIHSLSDLFTDAIVLIGSRLSLRPADESHPYGHGRYDTMSTTIVGIALVVAGGYIVWDAGQSIYRHEHSNPGIVVLIVALIAIASKEWLYRITRRVSIQVNSAALKANAWHHRSDALSSVAVLLGAFTGLLGWGHGDQAAAIAVGFMVGAVGLGAMWNSFVEFTEGPISPSERSLIETAIRQVPGVKSWHRMRTRVVGREAFMDIHVLVDPTLSVVEGHEVCTAVEEAIEGAMQRPINVTVHCEPEEETNSTGSV